MYYNDYEDYMRSVLGYSNTNENTYVEQMYPEIYKIINPMVCKMCDSNTEPVTEYLVEQMADDIYDIVINRVEVQNVINLNIGTRKADEKVTISAQENRGDVKENRETRSPAPKRNRLLRDLIRILILNRIIRPGRPRPNRPPFRPGPGQMPIGPRPPMPGGPGFGPGFIGPRPPMPRYDDYEW